MLVIAGETRGHSRPKTNPVSAQMERMFRDAADEGDGGVAVAVEKAVSTQVAAAAYSETRVEGLNLWFQHAMERASQRFTVQARVITVLLSIALVMGAHFNAIRIFQSLSSDAQTRAQLNASADALARQAEQLPRAHEGSRSVVPDVYRAAMVTALGLAPAPAAEPVKTKSRHSSRSSTSSSSPAPVPAADAASAAPTADAQASASEPPSAADAGQAAPPVAAVASTETPRKERKHKSSASANKSSVKEPAAVGLVSTEDPVTVEAKRKAAKALESRPGFASREDAALWLRETLAGSPALDHLAASYEQEVNAELGGEGDKLIDQSASIKGELARTRLQFIPEPWPGWTLNGHELPGMLLAIVFLSLSAPICYNLLKSIASLRPLRHIK
jgi:hypothetical protein